MKVYGRETIDRGYILRAKNNIANVTEFDKIDYIRYVSPFTSHEITTKINSLFIDTKKANNVDSINNKYLEKFKNSYEACYNAANKLGVPMMNFDLLMINYRLSITSYCEFMNLILKLLNVITAMNDHPTKNENETKLKYNTIFILLNTILRNIIRTKYIYEKVVCNDNSLSDLYGNLKHICKFISSCNKNSSADIHSELYAVTRMFFVILKAIYGSIYNYYNEILDYDEIIIPKHCYYLIADDLRKTPVFNCDTYYYIIVNVSSTVDEVRSSYETDDRNDRDSDRTNVKYVLMGNNKNIITDEIVKEINRIHKDSGLSLIEISQGIFHKMIDESITISFHIPSKAKCAILYQYPDARIGTIYTKDDEIVLLEIDNKNSNGNDKKLFVLFSNKDDKEDKTIYGITLFSRKYEGNKHIFDVITITDLDTDSDYVLQ